jgi:hypothetical protein
LLKQGADHASSLLAVRNLLPEPLVVDEAVGQVAGAIGTRLAVEADGLEPSSADAAVHMELVRELGPGHQRASGGRHANA